MGKGKWRVGNHTFSYCDTKLFDREGGETTAEGARAVPTSCEDMAAARAGTRTAAREAATRGKQRPGHSAAGL